LPANRARLYVRRLRVNKRRALVTR